MGRGMGWKSPRKYRRRKKSFSIKDTITTIIGIFLLYVLSLIIKALKFTILVINTYYFYILTACILITILLIAKLILKHKQYKKLIKDHHFDDNIQNYIIKDSDFKRENRIDRNYRKKYKLTLLNTYDNKCANCERSDNGFDLDHFFIPKSSGGNFILKRQDGTLINNAIPLCETCNRSKSNQYHRNFFSERKLKSIIKNNYKLSMLLNGANIKDSGEITPPVIIPTNYVAIFLICLSISVISTMIKSYQFPIYKGNKHKISTPVSKGLKKAKDKKLMKNKKKN